MSTRDERSRGARRSPPSARRLLVQFLVFALVFSLVVVVAVAVVLAVVRDRAEDDVDAMLLDSTELQLEQSARQQAETVEIELRSVQAAVEYLADVTMQAYAAEEPASADEVARYRTLPSGAYSTVDGDPGQSAMFYGPFDGVTDAEKAKASYLAAIDIGLKGVVNANPLAAAAYLNTSDGMTRIYPGFPIDQAFEGSAPAQDFNFYYEADLEHNPDKGVAWTSAYIDPARQGWIVSAVAPVYTGDFLEGVSGVDVRVKDLVGQLLSTEQAFGSHSILLDSTGVIIAMPPATEELLDLVELTDVEYETFINEETFKPDDFNVTSRDDTQDLAQALAAPSGTGTMTIGGAEVLASWTTLDDPDWIVVSMVPVESLQDLHAPGERIKDAAVITLWVVAIAFVLLSLVLTWRGRRHSLAFTRPLEAIDEATARIAAGDFEPTLPPAPVAELERTGEQLLAMGRSLKAAQERMLADAERLRVGEQRYRAIFENVAEPVLTIDLDGIVVDANEAADEMFGQPMEGVDLTATFGTDQWREPGRREVTVRLAGQAERVLELAISRTGSGVTTIYTLTAHDVTAETEARHLLEEARATAERTARVKDEFLASMSHEIRTPLNGVIGVLSLLADRPLPDDARRELAVARRSADDLLVLVSDVLDFAKIEAGEVSVVATDVRLFDVLEGVCQLYQPFADEQGDTLSVIIDADVPEWVRLDPTRVRQVLVNLVSNALKFTMHGAVAIRVHRAAATAAEADPGTFDLLFEVADTGAGIDPTVQPRLFERFSQGDPLAARKYPGTGLGLAIAKRLTELMDGTIGVHSVPGDGSTFWFTVPSAEGAPATTVVDDATPGTTAAGSLRVLVAEDNDVNRYLVVAILERLGHQVVAVVNGREAVEAAQTQAFDLVLMDVQMPVANGIDATQAIRALPGTVSRIPILAVTANVLPAQQDVYRESGFTGWVPKPLTLEQVERAIASVVPQAARPVTVPEPEATIDTARFDAALIEQYRSVIGADGARQMVDLFLQTLDERTVELRTAAAAGDLAEVRRVGHAVKGMAAAVGAVELSRTGEHLQHSEPDAVTALMVDFEAAAVAARDGVAAAWDLTD